MTLLFWRAVVQYSTSSSSALLLMATLWASLRPTIQLLIMT